MFVDVLVPVIGLALLFVSAQRTSFSQHVSMKMRACLVIGLLALPILFGVLRVSSSRVWLLIGGSALFLRVFCAINPFRARELSLEEATRALDLVLLSMKSGRSMRSALREARSANISDIVSRVLQDIIDRLELGASEILPGLAGELLAELRAIEHRGTRATESVESLRAHLRLRSEFRHKSGQVTLQARAQAGLAAALYAPLLVWHLYRGAWSDPRVWLSCLLFVAAQTWISVLSRRFRWTV